jgi:hypothetical protein
MEKKEICAKGKRIVILGSIYGLVEDGELVKREIKKEKPEVIALGISKEDLEALVNDEFDEKNNYEINYKINKEPDDYIKALLKLGKVSLPSPDLMNAIRHSQDFSIDLVPIDLNDEEYSEILCKNVLPIELILFSRRRVRRMKSSDANDFSKEWDRKKHGEKGFKKINEISENVMAERIVELSKKHGRILAIVDLPRLNGVVKNIEENIILLKRIN